MGMRWLLAWGNPAGRWALHEDGRIVPHGGKMRLRGAQLPAWGLAVSLDSQLGPLCLLGGGSHPSLPLT